MKQNTTLNVYKMQRVKDLIRRISMFVSYTGIHCCFSVNNRQHVSRDSNTTYLSYR